MEDPRHGAVRVRVPATSANLGPGFDSLGLALGLYDDVVAVVRGPGVEVDVTGEGEGRVPTDGTNLVARAVRQGLDRAGVTVPGLRLQCTNRIPHGRGLGSSAAAVVAGLLLARGLATQQDPTAGQELSDATVLAMAAETEGHPDNVAACLLGGLTIAWQDAGAGAEVLRLDPHHDLRPVVAVPEAELATSLARGLLPATVPHADAAHTAGRAALLVAALTTAPDLLLPATEDRLHQPYRAVAMPASAHLVEAVRRAGLGAVVSGAGPSVLVLARSREVARTLEVMKASPHAWRLLDLAVDRAGAQLLPERIGVR